MSEIKKSKIEKALEDYNKVAITRIESAEIFSKLISLSPKVRAWYQDWSFQNSAFSQMPDSFKESGITAQQWSEIENKLPELNRLRKELSLEIEKEAKKFAQFQEQVQDKYDEKLKKLEDPLIKILKVNITCLDLEDQLKILSANEDLREELEKEAVEKLRVKLLKDLKEGKFVDPLQDRDYMNLLSIKDPPTSLS